MIALAEARNYASVGGGSLVREGRKVYVDATYGSDTTGAVNRGDFPFVTLAAANAAAIAAVPTQASPINLHVRPGTYAHATGLLGDWMSLSAEGPQITTLNYTGDLNAVGPAFKIGNGTLIQGVSVVGAAAAGVFQALAGSIPFNPVTAWTVTPILMDVWWDGDSDGIYFDGANGLSVDLYRCRIKTKWDVIRSWRNTLIRAFNCELISLGPTACNDSGAIGNRIASMDLGVYEMFGGTASVSGSPNKNTAWQTGGNAKLRLFAVRWDGSGTNYNGYDITTGSLELSGSGRRDGAAITGVTSGGGSVVYKDAESVVAAVNAGTTTIADARLTANVAFKNANNNFSVGQTVTGTMTATMFSGSGASLTALPAANVTGANALPDGVLSTNIPQKNALNTWTLTQTFSGNIAFSADAGSTIGVTNRPAICAYSLTSAATTTSPGEFAWGLAGTAGVRIPSGGSFLQLGSGLQLGWSAGNPGSQAVDFSLVRVTAGVGRFSDSGSTNVTQLDVRARNFTVATLPTPGAGTKGRTATATDARVSGQGAGAGTGSLVVDNGTAWQLPGTSTTAVA